MDTINNMATAAAKAVWGNQPNGTTSTEEPISGKHGDVSKGEPYDAGNMEHAQHADLASPTTDKTSDPMSPAATSNPTTSTTTASTTTAPTTEKTKTSSAMPGDSTKIQSDVRSPADPTTDPSTAAARTNVDNTADGMDTDANPVKVDGPGPKPVAELAREHGGDAGSVEPTHADPAAPTTTAAAAEDGPQTTSHGEGTGEKYVKTTGLAADGGNFDATQPGAGREADRLLEEKGIHHDTGVQKTVSAESKGSAAGAETGEKKRLRDRIKGVFHKDKGSA